jgi:hypothetical protein
LFDTTVYIDQLKGELPKAIVSLISSRTIFHATPALAEIAVTVGALNPTDARTRLTLRPILETLERIPLQTVISPPNETWLEAAVIAGIFTGGSPQVLERHAAVSHGRRERSHPDQPEFSGHRFASANEGRRRSSSLSETDVNWHDKQADNTAAPQDWERAESKNRNRNRASQSKREWSGILASFR